MIRASLTGAVLLLALAVCGGGERGLRPLRVGDAAPGYGARTLAGDSLDLAGERGRPVLLDVWATWCVHCRREMPEIEELFRRFDGRLTVLGVSVDRRGAGAEVERFVGDVGVTFPVLLDPDERVVRRFTTMGVPETFLIDAEGVSRRRWTGRFLPLAPDNLAVVEEVVDAGG